MRILWGPTIVRLGFRWKSDMKRKTTPAAFAAWILLLLLFAWSLHRIAIRPFFFSPIPIPESHQEAIINQSAGLYSQRLPLVPVCAAVDSHKNGVTRYTVYYFPFGSVGMSYSQTDGYNIEKSLTPLQ